MFIGKYNKSVILTYLGVVSAVTGAFLAFNHYLSYAFLCLIFSGLADLFDGKIARMCKRDEEEKAFGIQIDSLADMISFVMLPVTLVIGMGFNKWYHALICALYVLAAIIRLGYFNIKAEEAHSYYQGVPVTYSALGFSLIFLLFSFVPKGVFEAIYCLVVLLFALFFVLNIPIKKPSGAAYIFFGILAVAVSAAILVIGA